MSRTNKGSKRLTRRSNHIFLKGNTLIAGQNRLASTYQAITVTDRCRDMSDLIAAGFSLPG